MDNEFSLELVNQDCPMKRGTSNFQHLESYHALYPDLFTDYSSCHDTNMQTNSPLWPTPILMRSDLLYKYEGNIYIQDIEDENNFMNIAHKSHAYDNIKESKLEDQIISHNLLDFGDTNIFNCKLIDSRSNIIGPNSDTKIVEHQQILGSSNIQFQEQKNMNLTLTLKNHSLVQAIVAEKESMILGPKTESLNDSCINHDFAFFSSQIEQNYLIPSQNISTNQNMDNDFSLELVNQDCPMKRGTSNFQHLES